MAIHTNRSKGGGGDSALPTPYTATIETRELGEDEVLPTRDVLVLTVPAPASAPAAHDIELRGQSTTAAPEDEEDYRDVRGGDVGRVGGSSAHGGGGDVHDRGGEGVYGGGVRQRGGDGAVAGGYIEQTGGSASASDGVGGGITHTGGGASGGPGSVGGSVFQGGGYGETGGSCGQWGGQGSTGAGGVGGAGSWRGGYGASGGSATLEGGGASGNGGGAAGPARARGGRCYDGNGGGGGNAVMQGGTAFTNNARSGGDCCLIQAYEYGSTKSAGFWLGLATSDSDDENEATKFLKSKLYRSVTSGSGATHLSDASYLVPEHTAVVITSRSFPVKTDGGDAGYVMRQSVYRRTTGNAVAIGAVEPGSTPGQENGFGFLHSLSVATVNFYATGKAAMDVNWRHFIQVDFFDVGS